MTIYTKRDYGPPKPNTTPAEPVILDRFGVALAAAAAYSSNYNKDIPGFPVILTSNTIAVPGENTTGIRHARAALVGVITGSETTARLYDIGARIIHLAQCVREAGLCSQYLEYTTLPADNNSGLFGSTWLGTGTRYVGDLKAIYDDTISSLPYTASMFSEAGRNQYDNNPIIPFRLAHYIKAFMEAVYINSAEEQHNPGGIS